MKTCVIYSGAARTFAHLFDNHRFFVHRKLPNPTFFVSIVDDEDAGAMEQLGELGPLFMERVVQPEIPEPEPIEPWTNGYQPSAKPQGILRQLWALNRAWEFVGAHRDDFDLFVRVRPDLNICRFVMPLIHGLNIGDEWKQADYTGPMPVSWDEWRCYTPPWSTWGGVNDRFAIMGRTAADAYFTTFLQRDTLFSMGCPLHPETMIGTALELAGITPAPLDIEFITRRKDGLVPLDPQRLEMARYARTRP